MFDHHNARVMSSIVKHKFNDFQNSPENGQKCDKW